MMIFDIHTHICPSEITNERERFFSGEENFAILYRDPRARLITATELVEALDSWSTPGTPAGAAAFGFTWNDDEITALCNDYVLDAAKRYPGRILPFCCVNPTKGQSAVKETERCLAAGAKGIGEIATYNEGLGEEVRRAIAPLAEMAVEADVPLLLHVNEPVGHDYPGKSEMTQLQIYELVKAHPKTKWILAHMGGGIFIYNLLKKEAEEVLANVWYDTAAAPFLYKPEIYRQLADAVGIEKLLFGSDYPLLGVGRYRAGMEDGGLTTDEIALALGGNAKALLRL